MDKKENSKAGASPTLTSKRGPFGRGWEVKRFAAQVIEPQAFPIIAYPLAWSPGYDHPIEGDVIYIDLAKITNLDDYKGKVEGSSS